MADAPMAARVKAALRAFYFHDAPHGWSKGERDAMRAALAAADAAAWSTDMEAAKAYGDLVDLWATDRGFCGCYYDRITDDWRSTRNSGHLFRVPARVITNWRPGYTPPLPAPLPETPDAG